MTTIAWHRESRSLAADTGSTMGDMRLAGHVHKLGFGPNNALVAAAGRAGFCVAFLKWAADPTDKSPPVATSTDDYFDRGIVIDANGTIEMFEPAGAYIVRDAPYFAMGSGRDFAIGAMAAGAGAGRAVEIAMLHDPWTFGMVDVMAPKQPDFIEIDPAEAVRYGMREAILRQQNNAAANADPDSDEINARHA